MKAKIILTLTAIILFLVIGYMAGRTWIAETSDYIERFEK